MGLRCCCCCFKNTCIGPSEYILTQRHDRVPRQGKIDYGISSSATKNVVICASVCVLRFSHQEGYGNIHRAIRRGLGVIVVFANMREERAFLVFCDNSNEDARTVLCFNVETYEYHVP